ncbi:nicotinamide riboside transporter PnuC [Fructobacillus fructosus]|uniref:Nicotinamide riboside transporter PnuC (PnuC) n=1 Tax=Fructobacillus fructosus TaxID=1631 RepID=A0ABM9MQQ4_9LACO|nr:nicotinamide riboside transporter PnuC [Fructobacillus fructosus]MBC9118683.1 nicotinamide mononucleotide transporter [Fructobacillus fructosus]MBD9365347.1 nicotinamide mononucleotide transporter [Leuconostoc mesenteroides]CAK1232386.1 Nicotinamide riboside transporter PnuC (PnuC) [Fructobacillus fructosus]CAK1235680.1 Nicotinamide riboside transporter PnuC (PnuC) [Fructobacillus fructosus]
MNQKSSTLALTFSPKAIWSDLISLNKATKAMLSVMVFAQLLTFLLSSDRSGLAWLTLWTGLAAVINLALVDQGKQSNFFWGLICTAAWMMVALHSRTFGDVFAQGFAFLMQFSGIYFWARARNSEKGELVFKKMSKTLAWSVLTLTILTYLVVLAISKHLNGLQVYLDSAVLPLNIIGQLLMTYGYRSQWFAWITVDIVQVLVWAQNIFVLDGSYAISMLVLQIVMLANALYGAWYWYTRKD